MNNPIRKSCFIISFSLFAALLSLTHAKTTLNENKPCKRIVLYYHDILFNGTNAANATAVKITNASAVGNFQFGTTVVFDDRLTEDGRLLSPAVARAQGFYVYDKKNSYSALFAFTLVFNSSDYKGTINVIGADPLDEKTRDLSVIGGTGDFFMTRGILTFVPDEVEGVFYFRLKMDIKLYECYNK